MKHLLRFLAIALMVTATPAFADSTISALPSGGVVQTQDEIPIARPSAPGQNFSVTVGSAATQNIGTSGPNVPLLSTGNTWSGLQSFLSGDLTAADPVFTGGSIALPSGSTSQRPISPINGEIRYSTTSNSLEAYVNGAWGPIAGSAITALTGDVTASGSGSVAATLGTVNSNVGTFGSASSVPQITINAKGLVTAASSVTITPSAVGAPTTSGTGATGTWGIAITGNAATVTTNANLNGPITSTGNTTSVASQTGTGSTFVMSTSPTLVTPTLGAATGTSLNLSGLTASSAVETDASKNLVSVTNTGTGNNVLSNSPTLVTPALGTPSSAILTNATGLPLSTGVLGNLGLAQGGTGATTAQAALTNLNASVQIKPTAMLWGFGDSFMAGYGATSANVTSYFGLISADTPVPYSNQGAGGTTVAQINLSVFKQFYASPVMPSVSIINGGENDNTTCSGASATCGISYYNMGLAAQAWAIIPMADRILASAATKTGTWAAGSDLYQPTLTTSYGTSETNATSGSTLTFSVPSSSSTKIGLTYLVTTSATGSFTATIDGVSVTDNCSSTTTYSAAPCAANPAVATSAFYRQEYTVTPNQTHTVVVTNASSNNIEFVSVDWLPSTSTATNAVFKTGVPSNWATNNYALWNTIDASISTALQADGLPSYFVNVVSGTPGVNNSTDFSTSATTTCPATTTTAGGNHPNDCGHYHIYQTIVNTELANNYVFSNMNVGGKEPANTGVLSVPLTTAISNPNGTLTHNQIFSIFSNSNSPFPTGLDVFRSGSGISGLVGFTDGSSGYPWSGSNVIGLYSTSTFRFWDCAVNYSGNQTTTNGNSSYLAQACVNTSNGVFYAPATVSAGGAKFTTSGCSISSTTGGPSAGKFTLGANSCSAVITINGATGVTAPNGWSCRANDETSPTVLISESANSTTTATLNIPAGAGTTDVIDFACTGF